MSKETKHTKGPWSVFAANDGCVFIHNGEPASAIHDGVIICEMQVAPFGGLDHNQISNARLIASAPELLEALEEGLASLLAFEGYCLEYGKHGLSPRAEKWKQQARNAIAKARGME